MSPADEPNVLLNEMFDDAGGKLPPGWHADGAAWRTAHGTLRADSLGGMTKILAGKPDWQNYEITVTATFEKVANDSRWLAVVFRAEPSGGTPYSQCLLRFQCNKPRGTEFAVSVDQRASRIRKWAKLAEDCRLGQPRRLRVVVRGSNLEFFVDGQRVFETAYCVDRDTGCVGLAASGCVARFDGFHVRPLAATPKLGDMPPKPVWTVAHRGFSAVAPENTVAAIVAAIRAGADGSECDVRRSKDGRIIAMHDLGVDRTTNGKGKVEELTFAQLRKLDAGAWKNKKFAGERIPTLDEILAAHKDTGCVPVVEIKIKGIEKQVIDAIRNAGMMDQTTVIAFDGEVVREMRTLEPRLPCAWLCGKELHGTPAERADWIQKQAKQYKTNMVDLFYGMLSRELVAELHRRGMVVWAWTVDDTALTDALMRWGVDSITTNRPDAVAQQSKQAKRLVGSR